MAVCTRNLILICLYFTLTQSFNLTVLHTNDVHARFEQFDKNGGRCSESEAEAGECYGGVARRLAKIKEMRDTEPNMILLDGGDQSQGTLWFSIFKGKATTYFMEKLGYNAMTLGNHEFDNGIGGLLSFIGNATFPIVSANIDTRNVPEIQGMFNKSTILTVGGEKIGVVGYTTRDTPIISSSGDLIFTDEVTAVQAEVDKLTSQGINKIIALGHSGFPVDKEIAQQVTGVDIVVGGHTNTFLYTGSPPSTEYPEDVYPLVVTQPDGSKVLVISDFWLGKYLGHLQVSFDIAGEVTSWGGNPILLDNSIIQDNNTLSEMQPWQQKVTEFGSRKIGTSLVLLNDTGCRLRECNLGNMITDALVYKHLKTVSGSRWANISIGVWNSGSMRSPIDKGEILVEDVLAVTPFGNSVDIVKLSGQTLWATLEHAVSGHEKELGRFVQVSGLRVVYNISKPVGSRVVSIDVRCADCLVPDYQPIVKDKVYEMATSTFLLGGGDGFAILRDNAVSRYGIDDLEADVIMEYIRDNSPIYHGLEGRIRFVSGLANKQPCYNPTSWGHAITPTLSIIPLILISFLLLEFNSKVLSVK